VIPNDLQNHNLYNLYWFLTLSPLDHLTQAVYTYILSYILPNASTVPALNMCYPWLSSKVCFSTNALALRQFMLASLWSTRALPLRYCNLHDFIRSSHNSDPPKTEGTTKDTTSEHKTPDNQSSSSNSARLDESTLQSAANQDSSAARTAAYVENQVESQVPHRHHPIEASEQDHTSRIESVLEACETVMKK